MLPAHLKRYIVEQDYSLYTPIDQAVWRYIMRQLTAYLAERAHPCYLEGLEKTGISVERIPNISEMSEKLEAFGWKAVPVSGFIPPAAFMELQAHGYLPIAADLRSADHIAYTPAPDIVHEAAGHAPILIDREYAAYLKSYAQVARKAIISREDIAQYDAIRVLSDIKENADSTPEQISTAEKHLVEVTKAITHVSEAALLGRMNWWTAEYGLVGTLENPKIFGAGLLSSVGEAKSCLDAKIKKIPFSIDCLKYAYDITEPQPQLFVTPDFKTLRTVLDEFAGQMAFQRGGVEGLEKAKRADTVNTVQFDSQLQISGRLTSILHSGSEIDYLQFTGPVQLADCGRQIDGQGPSQHSQGFGSPVGRLKNIADDLSDFSEADLKKISISVGASAELQFTSGVVVRGHVTSFTRSQNTGKLILISFKNCRVVKADQMLFEPEWGTFDMAVGSRVTSVFGGPADRVAFGETEDFRARRVQKISVSQEAREQQKIYQQIRDVREALHLRKMDSTAANTRLQAIMSAIDLKFASDWLLRLELVELGRELKSPWLDKVDQQLKSLREKDTSLRERIDAGLRIQH